MPRIFIFIVLAICISISVYGCRSDENRSADISEQSKEVESVSSLDSTVLLSSTSDSYTFSNEEIESAKTKAEKYYKEHSLKPNLFQYDTTHRLYKSFYKQYGQKYEKDKLIILVATMEDPENYPQRGIALVREDNDSEWKVVGEGY